MIISEATLGLNYYQNIKHFTITGEVISHVHPHCTIANNDFDEANAWLYEFVGDKWVWTFIGGEPVTIIWFVNNNDALLFKLRFNTV